MNRKRALMIALITLAIALIVVPAALAAAGGGSAGFSGGGGGGGGDGGGGGGAGKGFAIYLIFRVLIDIALIGHGKGALVLVALALIYLFVTKLLPRIQAWWRAERSRGHSSKRATSKRARRVELAAAEASDDDPVFAPDNVRHAAENLFISIQAAWTRDDRIALRGLVAPGLLGEWERRLDDLRSQGLSNHVEVLEPPLVQYVGLANGGREEEDQVTVRIDAKLRDYAVDRTGRHVKRSGQFTETVRLREFWTLQRRGDHWILASIEQGGEGAHALQEKIVATEWSDEQKLKDAAVVEGAVAEAVPEGTRIAEVADLQFDGDARSAANDLSLADGRFAPDVLEVAARRVVAGWALAVDGDELPLRRIAEPDAVRDLLHPGDPSARTRLVVRGPEVKQIRIHELDASAVPPTMTLDIDLAGRRYIQNRDTTAIVSGSQTKVTSFTERWTLALTDRAAQPWRLVRIDTPAFRA
jgi:predicted lipid-binding transport protein (Tim44 family)